MKFRISVLLSFSLLLLLSVPAYAEEASSEESPPPVVVEAETQVDDKNIVVNVTLPPTAPETTLDSEIILPEELPSEVPAFTPYSTATLDESAPAADTMSSVIVSLFGTYTPRTETVTDYLADGSAVTSQRYVPGVAGLDWPWLSGVALFGLCLLSFFKLLGGVLKRG